MPRFDAFERDPHYLIHVDELLLFFLDQIVQGFRNPHLALARALAEEVGGRSLRFMSIFRPRSWWRFQLSGLAL